MSPQKFINTYIITGFLGTGKTTLLNHLLSAKSEQVNFVIENEFGKVSVDSNLVNKNYTELFELNNGCICCSLDSELIEVLTQLIRSEKYPDNLFIEASGVADAGMLAAIFRREDVSKFFNLQNIVCIIDAESFEDRISLVPEILRQIVAADLIVINKCDLVQDAYVQDLEKKILSIHPFVHIQKVNFGQISLNDYQNSPDFYELRKQVNEFSLPDAGHRMKSIAIPLPFSLDRDKLYSILSVKLFLHYQQIYRIKGFVKLKGESKTVLVQSTGNKLSFTSIEDSPKELVLVFIGRDIERKGIEKFLFDAGLNDPI
jgi:G3E family GTPase